MNVWECYQQASEAVSYTTKNYIFFPYEFIKKDSNVFYYPPEISTKLIHFISTGNTPQVLEMFNLIHQENIEERTLPVNLLKYLLSDIRNTLLKARFALPQDADPEAVKVLDEYVKDFQKRNPTLRVFSCYLHQDEATPHLHIDFVPYVTNWKGKGMDTRVSLKQALKSLGFQGGNKHDTELNQWINHEKEVLAEIAKQYGIEWEQKGTHEEHLDVYNFKKKERKKEVQALEQEKEYLTAENEGLIAQIAEVRADIQLLKDDEEQAVKDKEEAEKRAEKAEKDLHSLEERRERLQPVMDNVSKEIKEYGTVKAILPEAGTLERATTYRDKKIKPLFTQMKNKIAAMAAQVKELTKEVEKWKHKYQETKQAYNRVQRQLDTVCEEKQQLSEEKQQLQGVSDRYDRVVRVLGENAVDDAVQQDIQEQKALEEKRQIEQMPKGSIHERLAWGARKSEMENQQRKKNKTKNRGMER